jgi:hypothetical protein
MREDCARLVADKLANGKEPKEARRPAPHIIAIATWRSPAGLVQYHDLRSQVGFTAAVAHARLRLSRLELIGGSGRTAGRYASAARAFISPTAFEQARGEALWERVEAGSGSLGAASSESAAGSGRLRACGCSCGC